MSEWVGFRVGDRTFKGEVSKKEAHRVVAFMGSARISIPTELVLVVGSEEEVDKTLTGF